MKLAKLFCFLCVILVCRQVFSAGENSSFVIEMPAFSVGDNHIASGRYVFVVPEIHKSCEVHIYDIDDYSSDHEMRTFVSANGQCHRAEDLVPEVLVDLFVAESNARSAMVIYRTPHYGIQKNIYFLLPVKISE